MLLGHDVQRSSWGYLIDRARLYNMNLCAMLSRTPAHPAQSTCSTADSRYSSMSDIHPAGRIVLNLWRIMRHEVALQSYTLENLAYHCLMRRMPAYAWSTMALRYDSGHLPHVYVLCALMHTCSLYSLSCVHHTRQRARTALEIIQTTNLMQRTGELAKLYGFQFLDVLTRGEHACCLVAHYCQTYAGSQYRVESMLLRLTRARGYAAPSPTVHQRKAYVYNAAACALPVQTSGRRMLRVDA